MDNETNYRLICGTLSSFIATSIVHPFDILKISKQLNIKPTYNFSSLYRGYTIGLFRQLTYSVPNIFFFTELVNKHKIIMILNQITIINYYMELHLGLLVGLQVIQVK